jgi:dihydropteroate synthase
MLVMGILNVTPDSFADGGRHNQFGAAVNHGLQMIAEGVDIIDIGGESTRPGAERVSEEVEIARTIPVITELAKHGVAISIDTMRASTAEAAINAGASIINDVSGGLSDSQMLQTAARLNVAYIAMHWRGHSKDMNSKAIYADVVNDVLAELNERIEAALWLWVIQSLLEHLEKDFWAQTHPMKEKLRRLNLPSDLAQLAFGRLEFIA